MSQQAKQRTPQPGLPPEQLQRWAKERHVSHWLSLPAKRFMGWEYWRFPGYPEVETLEELITYRPGRLSPATLGHVERVQQGALRFLEDKVAEARDGIREEARWLAELSPPRDPSVRQTFDLLLRCRQALRLHCAPRPRDSWGPMQIQFIAEPPRLLFREGVDAVCGSSREPEISIALDDSDSGVRVSCSCEQRAEGCSVRLAATDVALELLTGRQRKPLAAEVAAILAMPRWERVLNGVEAVLDHAETPQLPGEPGGRLGWLIGDLQPGYLVPRIEPLWCLPKKRTGGFRSRKLEWDDLRDANGALEHDADTTVVDLFHPGSAAGYAESAANQSARSCHAIAALAGHPLLFVRGADGKRAHLAVRRVTLMLAVEDADDGGAILALRLGPLRLTLQQAAAVVENGSCDELLIHVDPTSAVCYVAHCHPQLHALLAALLPRGEQFPEAAWPSLVKLLPRLATIVPLSISDALSGVEQAGDERTLFRMALDESDALTIHALVRPHPGAPALRPGDGPLLLYHLDDGEIVAVRRDFAAERQRAEATAQTVGLRDDQLQRPFMWAIGERDEALNVLAELQSHDQAITVEWGAGGQPRLTRAATAQDLRVEVSGRRDWFNLKGEATVDGVAVPLADLLAAIREKQRFVKVKGNVWVQISKQLEVHLSATANLVATSHGEMRLSPLAAPLIEDLTRDGIALSGDDAWRKLLLSIRGAETSAPELPSSLTATLRDYQLAGYDWVERLSRWCPGACLADDMGLGKTVQALALMCQRAALGPALVVAPTSVGHNWTREAARFAPTLRCVLFRGAEQLDGLRALGDGDVVITSYTLLARNIDAFSPLRFATLVLDEAQAIKNAATLRARAIYKLDAGFRLALTGTPLENRSGELWSIFRAIIPGLLGSQGHFRSRFAVPIERHDDAEARALLARLIQPFILRRLKRDVAPELPPRTEVRVDVELSPAERRLYEQVRLSALRELTEESLPNGEAPRRIELLAAITRLRQLACHPRLYDASSSLASSKMAVLFDLVENLRAEGHRALIFSQFTSFLALVREMLDRAGFHYRYLDGTTPETKRREEIDAFQRGDGELFLLSLKAGGFGLNLTAADYVIHLDPWWNPAVEDQATDRAHRIGQERPVTVYRLVAEDTIESAILDLHDEKRSLVNDLLAGTGSSAPLSPSELLALMRDGVSANYLL